MLAKITLYDGTIYKIADKTTDTEDGIYLGRIKDELSLVSAMQEAGNAPATINLTIINDDDFIPHSKDLWAADVMLTNDNGVSWRGKINFCNFDADGNLYVTASEKTAPELELQLPDEVRQVYTVDEDFHLSSVTMTIPLVIGGTHEKPILVPTILIDKTQGIYLICVGEIREVVAVYSGTEKLPLSEYMPWRGTAEQPYHKGFAYVAIASGKRLNADGSYAEINVEVVGLKLGDFTEEECRNGALFLYYFLTTAATGINGWGCGIDPSEIDTASFQSAITLCNQLGYKLDGIMWLRQSAQSWIDQICQAIHGKYSINANGKRSLFIDYAGNASKKTFTASNMQVDKYGKNSYTSVVYNKGILSYDYNPITGLFMQSAQYENAESIAQIGEQKFVGESYLIKDPTTALAVLEYTCKRSQTAAEAIEFKTDDIDTLLRAGDVITINRPDLSINNALYQIQNISITDYEASISAVKFDTSVFIVSGTPSSVNWGNDKTITPALTPAQATNLLLSTGFDINPDGTGTPYISGTFTVPDGGWLAAAVQYGIGTNPQNWTELALITEGKFKLSPVNVGTVYSIRVRMITSTGHSDYITGQITATGDTTPPAEPTIAVNATDKTVTVQCGLDNPPYDMGGFQIYRKKSTEADSAYTLIAMVAANRGYASYSDYVSEYITYNYKAKSYDRSGNLSTNFSNTASVTVTGIQANDVAATALAMPTGSILRLSAKNCTTASIAEANGVKDVSGNGNHGRAFGGVAVVQDSKMGDCFSFDGTNDYIEFSNNILPESLTSLTVCLKLRSHNQEKTPFIISKRNGGTNYQWQLSRPNTANANLQWTLWQSGSTRQDISLTDLDFEKWYQTALVFDNTTLTYSVYLDGVLVSSGNLSSAINMSNAPLAIGRLSNSTYTNYYYKGDVADIRIYPRALSSSEIKTIYMFPDDVTFGQLTADLIGTNIIKAKHLVMTEAVISRTAQIDTGVFREIIVGNTGVDINNLFYRYKKCIINGSTTVTPSFTFFEGGSAVWTDDGFGATWTRGSGSNGHFRIRYLGFNGDNSGKPYTITFTAKASAACNMRLAIGNVETTTDEYCSLTTSNQIFTRVLRPTAYCRKSDAHNGFVDFILDSTDDAGKIIYITNIAIYDSGASGKCLTKIGDDGIYTGALTAEQITAGTLNAARIGANAITAEKLNVASINVPAGCLCHISAEGCDLSNTRGIPSLIGNYSWTASNSPTVGKWNQGKVGAFFRFTSTAVLSSSNASDLTLNNIKSVSFWLYLDNATGWRDIFYGGSWPAIMDGMVLKYHNGSSAWAISNSLSGSRFYHIVINYDVSGNKITTYVDGLLHKTVSNITISTTGGFNYIGNHSNGSQPLKGALADVRLFNHNLSDAEIKSLYMIGADNTESGLITADRIAANAIKSRNYAYTSGLYSTAGTFLDLANGQIISKNFSIDSNGNATFKGALSGATGSFTGSVTASSGKIGAFDISSNGAMSYEGTSFGANDGVIKIKNTSTNSYSWLNYGYLKFEGSTGLTSIERSKIVVAYGGEVYISPIDGGGSSYDSALIRSIPTATSKYGLYVAGKARINTTDYGSDEKTKKDFQDVSTLDKLKKLRVCAWRFDEEKLVEKDNEFIDAENIKIESENKAIDAENAEIEKENEKRKNRKDGEPVELIPLKERRKLREHRIADKNANHPLNIGCMAGEFNKAFGTNDGSEDCLSVTDTIGVCMRAIQELAEISDAQKAEIAKLKALLLKTQQNTKSELTDHFNDLVKEPTNEDELIEPSFDELLKDEENQEEEQKK